MKMPSDLMTPERLEHGYVMVLPGIEGKSFLNRNIVRGLLRADVPYGIENYDWTSGLFGCLWNLRSGRRHREQAKIIAGKISDYRRKCPTQPVYLIGHSGGGAMTLFALEQLPVGLRATGGLMLLPAISNGYDLSPALSQTERGLWCFHSNADAVALGLATIVLGTCDGFHRPSAGMTGFKATAHLPIHQNDDNTPALHEVPYRREMMQSWNLGGHFGPTSPAFVQTWIAPILMNQETPLTASARERSHTVESPDAAPLPVR